MYVSTFFKLEELPSDVVFVSIAARTPPFYSGLVYGKLAPSYKTFVKFKETNDRKAYETSYISEILSKLEPAAVLAELKELTGMEDDSKIILLGYEDQGYISHRAFVARWFHNAGIKCSEYPRKKE